MPDHRYECATSVINKFKPRDSGAVIGPVGDGTLAKVDGWPRRLYS